MNFEDFKNSQLIAYSLLVNAMKHNKISHAYLIDGNNNEAAFDFVMAFVKMIICNEHKKNGYDCLNCNICRRIDDGNYMEVKIIDTDSLVIKKEQLLELQSEFSRTGVEGKIRVYVIKNCEKMNKSASNSLLKFLEEPVEGIISILFTNHIEMVLSTVKSRCQLIKLTNNNLKKSEKAIMNLANYYCDSNKEKVDFLQDEAKQELVQNVVNFIKYFEENGLDSLIYIKKMWHNKFSVREDNMMAIFLMVQFYYDVFKYQYEICDYFFDDYLNEIKNVANYNEIQDTIKKLNVCMECSEVIKYNININLLLDDMIIRLGEKCECS